MAMSTTCKIAVGKSWKTIDIQQAIEMKVHDARCIECGERVRPHRKGRNGAAAHFEHLARNFDCSLSHHPPES
jgi:hypothetical protein